MISRLAIACVVVFANWYFLAGMIVPGRLVLLICLGVALTFLIGRRGPCYGPPGFGFVVFAGVVTVGGAIAAFGSGDDVVATSNLQRFLVTYPLAFVLGMAISRSEPGLRRFVSHCFAWVGVATAAAAIIEVVLGRSILSRDAEFEALLRDRGARALLGSEHALVLGVLLVVCLPFVAEVVSGWRKAAALSLVVGGIFATGSRGSMILAAVLLVVLTVPFVMRLVSVRWIILLLVAVCAGFLAYYAAVVWRPQTYSQDWSQNSLEYRPALYSFLPVILADAPFGVGLGTLPTGVWLIAGPNVAADIARSVDSQLVLSAMRMGWLGVISYVIALVMCAAAVSQDREAGLAGVALGAAGLFVALDAWDGLGVIWMLLLGMCAGALRGMPLPLLSNSGD